MHVHFEYFTVLSSIMGTKKKLKCYITLNSKFTIINNKNNTDKKLDSLHTILVI